MSGICRMLGCTPEQVRRQYAANIAQIEGIIAEADKLPTGRKHRGQTAADWKLQQEKFKAIAKSVCAS